MHRRHGQAGFTLLEVAIAMVTMAVLAFGVMFGFTAASGQDRQAYELQRSQNHAVSLIEQVESFEYDVLFAISGNELVFNVENMRYRVTVTQIQSDLLAISARVDHAANGAYPVTLTTLKTMKQEAF